MKSKPLVSSRVVDDKFMDALAVRQGVVRRIYYVDAASKNYLTKPISFTKLYKS